MTFAIDRVELVGGEEVQVAGSYTLWQGTVTGATTIANMALHANSPNSDQNYSAGSLTRVYIPISAGLHNDVMTGILTHADQDGTLKAGAVDNTAVITDAVITPAKLTSRARLGWYDGELPAVSSVTHNGNRSYDVVFASDVSSILSTGMRLEFTKTVASNSYMGGAFNGSSQYFTKTTPSGTLGTVTNNFTIEAVVQPTSYALGIIAGRGDATTANGLYLYMNTSGQVTAQVSNGAAGNLRQIPTYQSLPLNKKTHVAASWTGGTVAIYFDGVSVPVQTATTAGTAPTTAGTGGDFSIGRQGGSSTGYFTGYISNVAVFDAVLSAATIRQHATYKLTGSETNCIGAWSLDNTANDQSSAGNNLTAQGSVGYNAMAQWTTPTLAYGLVMKVATTTVTVQLPDGLTLPTTGGITSTSYSTQANPYGWVSDKGRWTVNAIYTTPNTSISPSNNVWANVPGYQIYLPIGAWSSVQYKAIVAGTGSSSVTSLYTTLSTASNTANDYDFITHSYVGANQLNAVHSFSKELTISAAATYYLNLMQDGSTSALVLNSNQGTTLIKALPSGL